ncbi:hypothetical protein DICA0_E16908 [Diutina catenulata]
MLFIAIIPIVVLTGAAMLTIPPVRQNLPVFTRMVTRSFFGGWFNAWKSQRVIYPPPPQEFTTNNRIFESWVNSYQELTNYTLFKQPTLLNFTLPDEKSNKVTQALFDILVNRDQYPNGDQQINLVNIFADGPAGTEMMGNYGVGKLPSIVLIKKQMPVDRYVPNVDHFDPQDLKAWIARIR